MKYVLNPFSGMVSGFHSDAAPAGFTAQIASLIRIINFSPQDLSSSPKVLVFYSGD